MGGWKWEIGNGPALSGTIHYSHHNILQTVARPIPLQMLRSCKRCIEPCNFVTLSGITTL